MTSLPSIRSVIRHGTTAVARWFLGWRVVQMFAADRPLAIATAICGLVSLAPLFVTTFLPLVDMGSTIGGAALLPDVMFGHGIVSQRYSVNWLPVPYWSGYLYMGAVAAIAGPFVAAKAIVAIGVLLLPLSVMRLLHALGRSPRLGLWAFLLAWDTNLYWGWVTYQIGLPAAMWLLARLIETDSWKGAARLIPWSAFIALTHPHAVALLGVAALFQSLVRPRRWRALGQAGLALAGLFVLIPWMVARLRPTDGASLHLEVEQPPLADRVTQFYHYTADVFTTSGGAALTALVFLVFIVGALAMAALRPRATPAPARSGGYALAFVLAAAVLYLTLPFSFWGAIDHWWTYPRYGTYVLLGLLLLPAPDLSGVRAAALTPGLALLVALTVTRVQQFAAYDERTRPYLRIIASMKRNTSFLPLDFDFSWEGTRGPSLGQLHGYAAAARSAYDPHLFDNPNMPLLFRHPAQPPQVDWFNLKSSFSFEAQGRYYDYIIIHPLAQDPLAGYQGHGVELVRDAGQWRLYRVANP